MVVDDLFRVVHAVVTDLDGVAIKDFSKLVVSRELIVYWGKEYVYDVGANIFAERGVVPEYVVPSSAFSLGRPRNYYKTTMTTRFFIGPRFVFFILAHAWDFRSHNDKQPGVRPSPSRSTCNTLRPTEMSSRHYNRK